MYDCFGKELIEYEEVDYVFGCDFMVLFMVYFKIVDVV